MISRYYILDLVILTTEESNANGCTERFTTALFLEIVETMIRLTEDIEINILQFDEQFLKSIFLYAFSFAKGYFKANTLMSDEKVFELWDMKKYEYNQVIASQIELYSWVTS